MRLVDDWKKVYKWHSAQALALVAAIPVVYAELPPEVVALIPPQCQGYLVTTVAVCGLILRLRKQGKGA